MAAASRTLLAAVTAARGSAAAAGAGPSAQTAAAAATAASAAALAAASASCVNTTSALYSALSSKSQHLDAIRTAVLSTVVVKPMAVHQKVFADGNLVAIC